MCRPLLMWGGMMTTLEDLYYGNTIPHEHSFKRGSAYSEVLGYVVRNEDDLKATLTEQQKEVFDKFKDCQSELSDITARQAFADGFILATHIMVEVMGGIETA